MGYWQILPLQCSLHQAWVIDIGFKILVKELHPDKGGSSDAMSRLNRLRDRLKQHA